MTWYNTILRYALQWTKAARPREALQVPKSLSDADTAAAATLRHVSLLLLMHRHQSAHNQFQASESYMALPTVRMYATAMVNTCMGALRKLVQDLKVVQQAENGENYAGRKFKCPQTVLKCRVSSLVSEEGLFFCYGQTRRHSVESQGWERRKSWPKQHDNRYNIVIMYSFTNF
jgi:hypothetical protein